MAQQLFTSVVVPTPAVAFPVQVGFTPGRIELINQSAVIRQVATQGWKAVWSEGQVAGSAIVTKFVGALSDITSYQATNGITIFNDLGFEQAQYGATISGFTNAAANTAVITVNSTAQLNIAAGSKIRVAALADNQTGTGSLDGDYDVFAVGATTITVVQSTAAKAVYISGGFVTVLQNSTPSIPNPPFNIYSNVPSWFNTAFHGFTIGTSAFAGWVAADVILVAAYDIMSP